MSWINRKSFITLVLLFISLIFFLIYHSFAMLFLGAASICLFFFRISKNFKGVFASLIISFLTLACLEGILPFTGYAPNLTSTSYVHEIDKNKSYFRVIPDFGYGLNPGNYRSVKTTKNGKIIYDVNYMIGDDGYRISGKDSEAQIFLFGGSFAFGEGLNYHDTLAFFLENKHGLTTKNYGVHGFGLHQALYNIEQGKSANNGYNLLLTSPWHALRSGCKAHSAGTPLYENKGGVAVHKGNCKGSTRLENTLEKSNLYKLIKKVFFNSSKLTDKDIELYLAIIASIHQKTLAKNSKTVVAFIKADEAYFNDTKWTNRKIYDHIQERSDLAIDVTFSERRETLDKSYYIHELDQHPSKKANFEMAMKIIEALKTLGK